MTYQHQLPQRLHKPLNHSRAFSNRGAHKADLSVYGRPIALLVLVHTARHHVEDVFRSRCETKVKLPMLTMWRQRHLLTQQPIDRCSRHAAAEHFFVRVKRLGAAEGREAPTEIRQVHEDAIHGMGCKPPRRGLQQASGVDQKTLVRSTASGPAHLQSVRVELAGLTQCLALGQELLAGDEDRADSRSVVPSSSVMRSHALVSGP